MMAASGESWAKLKETRQRLQKCWQTDLDWSLYPASLREVSMAFPFYLVNMHCSSTILLLHDTAVGIRNYTLLFSEVSVIMLLQGCEQVGKAPNLPPSAVLCGYLIPGSYVLSPAVVEVPETDWSEPVLFWLTVSVPTASGKSTHFRHLINLLEEVRCRCCVMEEEPPWLVDDTTFEKLGSLMHENSARLLGLYDKLTAFLRQIRLYQGGDFLSLMSWHCSYNSLMDTTGDVTQVHVQCVRS